MRYVFRFDDVCINADYGHIIAITQLLCNAFPNSRVIHAISPIVYDTGDQRVFPKILNAYSDPIVYNFGTKIGIPEIDPLVERASHGLIHVDHRLLTKEAQDMSITVSLAITKSNIFVPPFNKYNQDTEDICNKRGVELIRFEDGWRCMEYEPYNEETKLWYLHARELTIEQVKSWIPKK